MKDSSGIRINSLQFNRFIEGEATIGGSPFFATGSEGSQIEIAAAFVVYFSVPAKLQGAVQRSFP